MSLFVATSGSIGHLPAQPCVYSTDERHPPTVRSSGGTSFEPDSRRPSPVIRVTRHPALVQRVAEAHEIGNRTWSHPNMSVASAPTATSQLSVAAKAISKLPAIRPPVSAPSVPFSGAMPWLPPGSATRSCCGCLSSTSMESRLPPTSIARDARRGRVGPPRPRRPNAELRGCCRDPSSSH